MFLQTIGILAEMSSRKYCIFAFTPVTVWSMYTSVSFSFGLLIFTTQNVHTVTAISLFNNIEYLQLILFLYSLTISITLISEKILFFKKFKPPMSVNENQNLIVFMIIFIIGYFLASIFTIDASILGGSGNLTPVIWSVAIVAIANAMVSSKLPIFFRLAIYSAIIYVYAQYSYNSKRELLFLMIAVILIELYSSKLRIGIASYFYTICILILLIFLILVMSIARGYGDLSENDFWQNAIKIFEYFSQDDFYINFSRNTEVFYTFFHSTNAAQMVLSNDEPILYGLTLIKPLFIFFDREIFTWKPDSIIHIYTSAFNPNYRALGGSYPINMLSEFLFNFFVFGIVLFYILLLTMSRLWINFVKNESGKRFIKRTFGFYLVIPFLGLIRGSGFDIFFVELILALLFLTAASFSYSIINSILKRAQGK